MDDQCVGIMLRPSDGSDVSGDLLFDEPPQVNFIFCSHPLYPRKVDEDFESEYRAAGKNHNCALMSYEDLQAGKLSLFGEHVSGLAVYRGWMMKPEMYKEFYSLLEERGIVLINTPEEYDRYHMLPGWYHDFENETPESVWTESGDIGEAAEIAKDLDGGAYIVKDYVKSRKHEWYDACYIPNIRNSENFNKVVGNFIERQEDDLVGGVVLRKYINLKKAGYHEQSGMPLSEEYRVLVFADRIISIDNYWKDADIRISGQEKEWISGLVSRIRSNFVTIDLARKEHGALIVMELGDGQVSGLQQLDAEEFYGQFV